MEEMQGGIQCDLESERILVHGHIVGSFTSLISLKLSHP